MKYATIWWARGKIPFYNFSYMRALTCKRAGTGREAAARGGCAPQAGGLPPPACPRRPWRAPGRPWRALPRRGSAAAGSCCCPSARTAARPAVDNHMSRSSTVFKDTTGGSVAAPVRILGSSLGLAKSPGRVCSLSAVPIVQQCSFRAWMIQPLLHNSGGQRTLST